MVTDTGLTEWTATKARERREMCVYIGLGVENRGENSGGELFSRELLSRRTEVARIVDDTSEQRKQRNHSISESTHPSLHSHSNQSLPVAPGILLSPSSSHINDSQGFPRY